MFGIDDAIIASVAGATIGGVFDVFGQNSANAANRQMMNEANQFNAQQFATRYQTTVKDLEAAGLNPMLAYGQGGGSPPSAVPIAMQTNPYQRAGEYAQKAVGAANTAVQTDLAKTQERVADMNIAKIISEIGVNDEMRKKLSADTLLSIASEPKVRQETKNLIQQELLTRANTSYTNAMEAATRQHILTRKPEETKAGTWWGTNVSPYLKDFTGGASGAANMKFLLGR
jgi:hypothetical protein